MTYLKSQVIPEKIRVTISNVIKIPSNIFICLALLWIRFNQENEKTNENIIFSIFIVCFIATSITLLFSKIFSKLYSETIIKSYESEI
jgi:hypothetical protein